MKKVLLCGFVFALCAFVAGAQQITRFAVVDTATVYEVYFRESSAVKNYETKRADVQTEVERLTTELKDLQKRKVEAQSNDDMTQAMRLDGEITKKAAYLSEYTKAKNLELDNLKNSIQTSDAFYQKMYSVIARIAESDGYSMVLSLRQADSVLWYSSSVDITEKVIEQLGSQR